MDIKVLADILSRGSVFSIETNKTVNMMEGAPAQVMLKVSRYNITTKLPVKPDPTSWWNYTNTSSVVVKKGHNPKLYLLCAMYKGAGFGESEFFAMMIETGEFDMSRSYRKSDVERFMGPKEPFNSDYMTLPLDSIEDLTPINTSARIVAEKPWTCPDQPVIVQAKKIAPWHLLEPVKSKQQAWDPEFAPESEESIYA